MESFTKGDIQQVKWSKTKGVIFSKLQGVIQQQHGVSQLRESFSKLQGVIQLRSHSAS